MIKQGIASLMLFFLLVSSAPVFARGAAPSDHGIASWYSRKAPGVKRHTANGEIFDDRKLTCATRTESFGTRLRVKNLKNGKSVVCRVNDRGPHRRLRRRIDLTRTAFRRIADSRLGLVRVSVTKVSD